MNQEASTPEEGFRLLEAGGVLTINLDAIAMNWRFLQDKISGAECAGVVKANAYGLGIEKVVPALAAAGCRTFFVALPSEGIRVRKLQPDAIIYVLNGLLPGASEMFARHELRPVLGSMPEVMEWATFSKSQGTPCPAAFQVDTGVTRLGLSIQDAMDLAGSGIFHPSLVMGHFVASEVSSDPGNARQINAFLGIRNAFPDVPASMANSSGIFLPQAPYFDLVRPGYALYGGNPLPGEDNPMQPVVRLEGRIVQIRSVKAGTKVGYNGRWSASGPTRLATISIGYSDGYPRSASATDLKKKAGAPIGAALVAGALCPFAGTISMDLIIIDITKADPRAVNRGDLVTLIGDELTIDRVGENASTIGYEILTSFGQRYCRRYIGEVS